MRTKRGIELLLLLAAAPVVALIFILYVVNLSKGNGITVENFVVPIGLFAAFLAAHVVVRLKAPGADPVMLPIVFVLSGIGIVFVMRLSPELAINQLLWLFLGIACLIATLFVVKSIETLTRYKYIIMILAIILLVAPAVLGSEQNGSKIWLTFGGFSFQPGEIAKILVALFLAAYLSENREMLSVSTRRLLGLRLPDFKTLVPLLIMWAISMMIVIFERDLGSALLFFGIFLVMIYVSTGRLSYVIISILLLAVGGTLAFFAFDHVQTRVLVWLNPFDYAQTGGYQLIQAKYSLADGGFVGTGIGRGMPTSIPVVSSDFIFAAIAEEMGLLGAVGVLILFMLFCVRGFTVAATARKDVDSFTSVGLTASLSFQAFVIVGGVIGLIPLTGVTVPFMSQGGSSLVSSFIILGLLLRVGDDATGHTEELNTTAFDGGVLGRIALGKRLTTLVTTFTLLFAMLVGSLTFTMVVQAEEIRNLPSNNHTIARLEKNERGAILTSDGVLLAKSVRQSDGSYKRTYPEKTLASHLLGYYSTRFGTSGVENTMNDPLTGNADFSSLNGLIDSMAGIPTVGNDVILTIDSKVQKAAQKALEGQSGAVVVLEPSNGKVLGMASNPTYDVNDAENLLADENSSSTALYNRATRALYPPGSTFKTVTLTGALKTGTVSLKDRFNSPASMNIGGAKITNYDKRAHGKIAVKQAFAYSSNTVFGQIGEKLGAEALVDTANAFGFGTDVGQDFGTNPSLMPDPKEMTVWETAWASDGQPVGEHASPAGPQATVTQMALVAAGIANGGDVVKPHVVEKVRSLEGTTVSKTASLNLGTAASSDVAAQVREAMQSVVKSGTGQLAQISGADVFGKTGTAQINNEDDHSWFIGTAIKDGKEVTVAIIVEKHKGVVSVTPSAKEILEVALAR